MKRIKSALICGLVLAFASITTMVMADMSSHAAKATVRSVHGMAQYSVDNGPMMDLHPNTELPEGATVKTGPNASVDIQVNGRTSVVRVTADTTMTLKTMEDLGAGDSETMLNLSSGELLGTVKKISKGSRYEIQTPRGVAGIRGTDWAVQVTQLANGLYTVTFTSITGEVICVANVDINGNPTPVTKILVNGQSWTPPQNAQTPEAAMIDGFIQLTPDVLASLEGNLPTFGGPPMPGGTVVQGAPGTPLVFVPPLVTPSTIGGSSASTPPPQDGVVASAAH